MYDLHKIIIHGNWKLSDQSELTTVAMETDGMKVLSVLYLDDQGSIGEDKDVIKQEVKDQLYDDMYDDNDIKIKVKEVYDGKDAIRYLTKYISKRWKEDTQIYFYESGEGVFEKLQDELMNIDGKMYLFDYYQIFEDDYNKTRDIKQVMADNGLKMDRLLPDSQVAFVYYLTALIEKLFSR